MTERRSYLTNTVYVLAANAIALVVAFFVSPLIARVLQPEAFGLYALILRTGSAIPAVLLFSMNSAALYYLARRHGDMANAGRVVTTSLAFLACTTLLFAAPVYFVLSIAVPSLGFWGFVVAYFLGFALSLLGLAQAVQQGLERFKAYSALTALVASFAALAALAAALVLKDAVATALARGAVIAFVSFAGLLLLRCFGSFSCQQLRVLWVYAKPLGLAGIVGALIALVDRYLLAAYHSTAEVGYFDIAFTIATAALPFTAALLTTMAPRVIRTSAKMDSYYRRLSAFSVISLSLFGFGLVVFSDIIIYLLLGQAYLPGALEPLRLMALALPLMALYALNCAVFSSIHSLRAAAILTVALVVCSTVLNLLLVPQWASSGAAYANLGTYFLVTGAGMLYLWKRYGVTVRHTLEQLVLFALFLLIFEVFVHSWGFIAKAVLWCAFAVFTYLLNQELVRELIEEVASLLRSRAPRLLPF